MDALKVFDALNVSLKLPGRAYLPHNMGDFVEPPPKPNSKTLVFWVFQFRLANHQFRLANHQFQLANPNVISIGEPV